MPGVREQAGADLARIMQDDKTGPGWPVTVVEPSLAAHDLVGLSTDVAMTVDPNTGAFVSQRRAHVSLPTGPLLEKTAGKWPVGVSNQAVKPWLVQFADIHGETLLFKVTTSHPDRTVGTVTLELELYAQLEDGLYKFSDGSVWQLSDGALMEVSEK